jgi:hypothetical protein
MTATVRITFGDDAEAEHFAAMLTRELVALPRPGREDSYVETREDPRSIEAVDLERAGDGH